MALARQEFERANEKNRAILEPLVDLHLTAYDAALSELEAAHRLVAEETALELDAETREAGLWLLTGRAIGLARAAHDLAAAGYDVEVVPVIRSLHEASRLVSLITFPNEEVLVQRWLRGNKVERRDIVAALDRQEEAMRAEMIKEGRPPPGTTKGGFNRQYGRWSDFAHHRRPHLLNQVSIPARIMAAGRHPDWRSRAALVDHYGWNVLGLVSAGGSGLARLLGPGWFHDRFQPTYRALLALQERVPLAEIAEGSQEPPTPARGGPPR